MIRMIFLLGLTAIALLLAVCFCAPQKSTDLTIRPADVISAEEEEVLHHC